MLAYRAPMGLSLSKISAQNFRNCRFWCSRCTMNRSTHCALRAGAEGYVMKHEAMANVVQAIREVFNGRPYLSPAMAAQVITRYAQRQPEGETDPVDRLSDRELEILELIGKGNEVRQIAKLLHLSPKTVETHRAHIKEKLNLASAHQVGRFAVQWVSARGM